MAEGDARTMMPSNHRLAEEMVALAGKGQD